jgi:hypothetical protein
MSGNVSGAAWGRGVGGVGWGLGERVERGWWKRSACSIGMF